MPRERSAAIRRWPTRRGGARDYATACAFALTAGQILLVGLASMVTAREPAEATVAAGSPRATDEVAIREAAQAYRQAVEAGDRETLARLWMPDGDIIDAAGNLIPAAEVFAVGDSAAAAGPRESGITDVDTARPEIRSGQTTIRFVNADTAIEDGVVEITSPAGGALRGRFSATWVRQAGNWKLAAVREAAAGSPTGRAALADLAWMVGDWQVVTPAGAEWPRIEVTARWNDTRTYLERVMTLTSAPDAAPLQVTQRIGWDPVRATIHSWKFASDGAHGEADWHRDGGSWVAEADTIAADGTRSSTLNIYTYDGRDHCRWRSVSTDLGGQRTAAVDHTLVRKPSSPEADARSE